MKRLLIPALVAFLALFSACTGSPSVAQTAQAALTPTASPTPQPTATATPLPGKAILLTASNDDIDLAAQAEALLAEQAAPAGLTSETHDSLSAVDLAPEVKLVIALSVPADLNDLLAAAPQAQFVVVSGTALESTDQLTVIHKPTDQQAFVAGLTATLLSDDWRAAGLIPNGASDLQNAFVNGGGYYCGDCMPGWPLGASFPLVGGAAAPEDGPAWANTAADFFDNGKTEVFYLSAAADQPEVRTYLAGRTQFETPVRVVGELPPSDELAAQWAATVGFDVLSALQQALPSALSGSSAGQLEAAVQLSHVDPDLLSPGRQELVQAALDALASGDLMPNSVADENQN